jgi:cytoskeletal protein RodZ
MEPLETLESPGKYLKAGRESQKLSLKEVADATRIREAILRDFDEDRYTNLPSFYVKSFLSAYAECLGLNPNEVITLHEKYVGSLSISKDRVPKQLSTIRTKRANARVLVIWISVVLLIALIIYASFKLLR